MSSSCSQLLCFISPLSSLQTIANLGSAWPKFFVFAAVDLFSCRLLKKADVDAAAAAAATGATPAPVDLTPCYGFLPAQTDGYYLISFICFAIGVVWYCAFRKRVTQLGETEKKHWSCS